MKLVIRTSEWVRGKRAAAACASKLYNPYIKRSCCVGLYLQALGVPKEVLAGRASAARVKVGLPNEAQWLVRQTTFSKELVNSDAADALYSANDSVAKNRKRLIRKLFAKQGVEVEFVNDEKEVRA